MNKLFANAILLMTTGIVYTAYGAGDIAAGKAAMTSTSAACYHCHGFTGNGLISAIPKLADQNSTYLLKQMRDFKSGARVERMMAGLFRDYSDQDLADIAAYFESNARVKSKGITLPHKPAKGGSAGNGHSKDKKADGEMKPPAGMNASAGRKLSPGMKPSSGMKRSPGMKPPAGMSEADKQKAMTLGKQLYLEGDAEADIVPCASCHGPNGDGVPAAGFPSLRNQFGPYMTNQLKDYRSGKRSNDVGGVMRDAASKLNDKQIAAIIQFIEAL